MNISSSGRYAGVIFDNGTKPWRTRLGSVVCSGTRGNRPDENDGLHHAL